MIEQFFLMYRKFFCQKESFTYLAGVVIQANLNILKLIVILHVAPFNCLSIIIDDQNNSFHGQVGSAIDQISI